MLIRGLVLVALVTAGQSATDGDDDLDVDFTDDFLKGSEVEETEEDPAGLPPWYVKIKSILNKDIDPMRCSTRKYFFIICGLMTEIVL